MMLLKDEKAVTSLQNGVMMVVKDVVMPVANSSLLIYIRVREIER